MADTHQQCGIDALLFKNFIDMRARATNPACKPSGTAAILFKFLSYAIPYVHTLSFPIRAQPCMSPIRPKKFHKKSAGQCSVYLVRGIAKRPYGNKQSTPRRANIPTPLAGVDKASMSVHRLLHPSVSKIWRFSNKG